jgi:hypothetical protein
MSAARESDSVSSLGPGFDRQLFEPYERLLLLSIMMDDIPESPERAAIVAVIRACFSTIKQLQGRETRPEAYRSIELARVALTELRVKEVKP